jgi:putative salt-induced outer membrane protein YdiY
MPTFASLMPWLTFILLLPALARAELVNETEAGVVVNHGNSETESYSAKHKSELKAGKNSYVFSGFFLQSKQNFTKNAESWQLALRYEHELSEMLSGLVSQQVESNFFAGILQRYNSDIGAKQFLLKRPGDIFLILEAGYRFSREHSATNGTHNFQKGRAYLEVEKFWRETVSTQFWIEYIPNFTLPNDWLFNWEASVNASLSTVFALKTAYYARFSNSPPSAPAGSSTAPTKRSDSTLTSSLVVTF